MGETVKITWNISVLFLTPACESIIFSKKRLIKNYLSLVFNNILHIQNYSSIIVDMLYHSNHFYWNH